MKLPEIKVNQGNASYSHKSIHYKAPRITEIENTDNIIMIIH